MRPALLVIAALSGCAISDLHDTDAAFARWDGERVLCGVGVDGETISLAQIEAGFARAAQHGEVLILFAHHPGRTVTPARIDAILASAERAGLPSLTFPELADSTPTAGFSFGFDDASVDEWFALRDVFAAHRARVTFFVSNYGELGSDERNKLHALAADGHAIEAHGMGHRDAAAYVDTHGLSRYLRDEIDPLLEAMAADGFVPTTFAYPYGDRTSELDRALLGRFSLIRSLTYLDRSAVNSAPCPR